MTKTSTHTERDSACDESSAEFLRRIAGTTMVRAASLHSLIALCEGVLRKRVPGDFVETGVWRGGASFVMADVLRRAADDRRTVWMFDSFEGLPAPADVDGQRARDYVRDTDSPWYFDNCRADYDEVVRTATMLGLQDRVKVVKGWFPTTLPQYRDTIGPIALLRIDCDWFESTRCCLDELFDQVSPDGVVIVDDYYYYDGASLAVHDFLGRRGYAFRVESVLSEGHGVAYNESAFIRKTLPLDYGRAQRLPIGARFSRREP